VGVAGVADFPKRHRASRRDRQLDLLAFGVIALVIVLMWLPALTSGRRVNPIDDSFLHAARHEAVRKSLVEHHSFPLRSHWFGGGFPTLGEPEDPALNPLVLLSVLFGSAVGPKLIAFLGALASGFGTYALARYVLEYTRWGALFSGLMVGASLFIPGRMESGNLNEVCPAYLPLCMLLIALSCRGRRGALLLLPFVFYAMLSDGKQTFFVAMLCLGVVCLLDALPMFRSLTPEAPATRFGGRALKVLVLTLGVTFFVGMVRILPVLEFMSGKGGLSHTEVYSHEGREGVFGLEWQQLLVIASGIGDHTGYVTVGWLPMLLFGVAACCFWKRALPWVIMLGLFSWLTLADTAPFDLFKLLASLPIFSAIVDPYKHCAFEIILSIGVGAGQFFWLLRRLRRRWLEHVCALALIVAGVGFLYPKATLCQRTTYTLGLPFDGVPQQQEFFNIQGLDLPRWRMQPPRALTYPNVLQNVGTIDWLTSMPIAENAVPKYFIDAENNYVANPEYRGEAFFVRERGPGAALGFEVRAPPGHVVKSTFRPNSIAVEAHVRKPGILVINQNYHPAWRADRGEVFDRDGLIALRLRETGRYAIHLRYLPRSFVVGLVISIVSIAGWVAGCWAFGRRRWRRRQ